MAHAGGECVVIISSDLERFLIRADEECPDAVVAIQEQTTVSDEVERLRLVLAESEAATIVYHYTA